MRTWLLLVLTTFLLAACGGGGDAKGDCAFGPSACSYGTAGPGNTTQANAFMRSGTGDFVFTLPANVSVIRVQAQYAGTSSNFIVSVGNDLIVNEIIGSSQTPQAYDGTYLITPGGQVAITNSSGVSWTITATRSESNSSGGSFSKSSVGDFVFDLPVRNARYRVQATYSGNSQNFVVYANDALLINSIIGTSQLPSSFDGIYALPSAARIEVRNSSGVSWSFVEIQ